MNQQHKSRQDQTQHGGIVSAWTAIARFRWQSSKGQKSLRVDKNAELPITQKYSINRIFSIWENPIVCLVSHAMNFQKNQNKESF